jgi:hypothetical protein
MKRLLLALVGAAGLAVPAGASADFGFGHHSFVRLSGTGSTFTGASATASGTAVSDALGTGTFSLSLSTTLSSATTRTGEHGSLSCAPSSATLKLTGATTTNGLTSSLTGRECTFKNSAGALVASVFFGRGTVTGTGTLASLTGRTVKVFVMQRSDNSVRGFAHVRGAFSHDNDGDE